MTHTYWGVEPLLDDRPRAKRGPHPSQTKTCGHGAQPMAPFWGGRVLCEPKTIYVFVFQVRSFLRANHSSWHFLKTPNIMGHSFSMSQVSGYLPLLEQSTMASLAFFLTFRTLGPFFAPLNPPPWLHWLSYIHFHLLKKICYFPLLALKGIHHYWTYIFCYYFFPGAESPNGSSLGHDRRVQGPGGPQRSADDRGGQLLPRGRRLAGGRAVRGPGGGAAAHAAAGVRGGGLEAAGDLHGLLLQRQEPLENWRELREPAEILHFF